MNITEILSMPNGIEKARELAICALLNTEVHHKQWYIERTLEALGVNLNKLQKEIEQEEPDDGNEDWPWKMGIAP